MNAMRGSLQTEPRRPGFKTGSARFRDFWLRSPYSCQTPRARTHTHADTCARAAPLVTPLRVLNDREHVARTGVVREANRSSTGRLIFSCVAREFCIKIGPHVY